MSAIRIDFDGKDGLNLVRSAFDVADEAQKPREKQCERDYQLYHAFLDMSSRDPDRAAVAIPKLYSVIQTKVPREIKAAIGQRPYVPFEAKRGEYKEQTKLQVEMLDQLLYLAGFFNEFSLQSMMKTLYGNAFMECLPYYEADSQRVLAPDIVPTVMGMQQVGWKVVNVPISRLRFKLDTYAPWEVKVDPFAKDLETLNGCRYVIKTKVVSRREIVALAKQGAYGDDFDIGLLEKQNDSYTSNDKASRGRKILNNIGLPEPALDGDIGILFRYESPSRYVDVWNDDVILRDGDNPFSKDKGGHGLINLSRMIHTIDPHTLSRFWGNGDAKIIEILNYLLNDIFNITLDNHAMANQGKVYYALGHGVSAKQLIHQVGNKIGVQVDKGEDIRKVIYESYGNQLPPDHYALRQVVEDFIDLSSGVHDVHRGEEVQGDHTLGEVAMLAERGDSRQELSIKLIEDPYLKDLGHKCLCHINQFAKPDDLVEFLGEEGAMTLQYTTPNDLPGGFNYTFQGSDRVVNQILKQKNLLLLDKTVTQNPYLKPREWAEVKFEMFDLKDVSDKVLMSEEEMMMLQQQQMMAQQQQEAMQQEADITKGDIKHSQAVELKRMDQAPDNMAESAQDAGRAVSA